MLYRIPQWQMNHYYSAVSVYTRMLMNFFYTDELCICLLECRSTLIVSDNCYCLWIEAIEVHLNGIVNLVLLMKLN